MDWIDRTLQKLMFMSISDDVPTAILGQSIIAFLPTAILLAFLIWIVAVFTLANFIFGYGHLHGWF